MFDTCSTESSEMLNRCLPTSNWYVRGSFQAVDTHHHNTHRVIRLSVRYCLPTSLCRPHFNCVSLAQANVQGLPSDLATYCFHHNSFDTFVRKHCTCDTFAWSFLLWYSWSRFLQVTTMGQTVRISCKTLLQHFAERHSFAHREVASLCIANLEPPWHARSTSLCAMWHITVASLQQLVVVPSPHGNPKTVSWQEGSSGNISVVSLLFLGANWYHTRDT